MNSKQVKSKEERNKRIVRIVLAVVMTGIAGVVSLMVNGKPNPRIDSTNYSLLILIAWIGFTILCKFQMFVGLKWRLLNLASVVSWVCLLLSLMFWPTGSQVIDVKFSVFESLMINLFLVGSVVVDTVDMIFLFPSEIKTIIIGGFWDDW